MPDFSSYGGSRAETVGADTANSRGASVTSGNTNTKGSWAEIADSTPFQTAGFLLHVSHAMPADHLLDIGVGAAGSEVAVVENLLISGGKNYGGPDCLWLPLAIPAGSRISARSQATTGTRVMFVALTLLGPTLYAPGGRGRMTTYGANTADSGGAGFDPGGSANTKGNWTQITASTTANMALMYIAFGNQANATIGADSTWLVDIAVGAAGSEQIILSNIQLSANLQNDTADPGLFGPVPVSVPAGTRLAVRGQCTNTDATDRLLDCIVYGVD